jgi:hypothetical protein
MGEPSGLVVFVVMFVIIIAILLLMWLAQKARELLTWQNLGVAARWAWRVVFPSLAPLASSNDRPARSSGPAHRRVRPRPTALRASRGRFAGSLPGGNNRATKLLAGNTALPASGRGVTTPESVAVTGNEVTISTAEAAIIAVRLARGMSPSAVAKSLPGYSPKKNYGAYVAKVQRVKEELEVAEVGAQAEPEEALDR